MARLFILALFFSMAQGCTLFTSPPRFIEDGARQEIQRISQKKGGEETFRGSGSINLVQDGKAQRFRLAWAGKKPNLLRLEILLAGAPVESLAYNGRELMLRSATGAHLFYRRTAQNPSLSRLVGAPLALDEIHALLSGGFHVGPFQRARLFSEKESAILSLRPGIGALKKIEISPKGAVKKVLFTQAGVRVYSMRLASEKREDGLFWYKKIEIVTENNRATLFIDRIEKGIDIP